MHCWSWGCCHASALVLIILSNCATALEYQPVLDERGALVESTWEGVYWPRHLKQQAPVEDPPYSGWLAVSVCLVCFGSFGVPIKSKSVQDAQVHPLVFQSYKTFWVLATAWCVLTWEEFYWSPWGLVSGLCWVPSGVAAIVAVNAVGLAVGQAVWQVTILIVSFLWGILAFHEQIKHPRLAALAVLLLVIGLLGMTWVASRASTEQKEAQDEETAETDALLGDKRPRRTPGCRFGLTPRQQLGIGAALFNGIWGGSNLVPMRFAHLGGPRYVISFALGAAVVNAAMWVIFILSLYLKSPADSVYARLPAAHFGVMKTYGTICGILWSVGNLASMLAIKDLGQAVGYSCVQASIFVSGLWGILLYREIRGQNILYWFISAIFALTGVAILAKQKG